MTDTELANLHRSTAMLSPGTQVTNLTREQLLDLTRALTAARKQLTETQLSR